jgi:hypothetical protein
VVPQGRNSAESLVGIYHTTLLYSVLYATRTTYKKAAQAYAHAYAQAYAQAYAPRHFKYRYLMQIECKTLNETSSPWAKPAPANLLCKCQHASWNVCIHNSHYSAITKCSTNKHPHSSGTMHVRCSLCIVHAQCADKASRQLHLVRHYLLKTYTILPWRPARL